MDRGTIREDGARYVGTTAQGIEWWAYEGEDFAEMCAAFDGTVA